MEHVFQLWAEASRSTLDELQRPGALTMICGDRADARKLLDLLGEATAVTPQSVTALTLADAPAESATEVLERLAGNPLLFDVEALCWLPWLQMEPVRVLREHARRSGAIVVWPGQITARTATFSSPGRRDHVHASAGGMIVMRPKSTRFPDEVPFTSERILR